MAHGDDENDAGAGEQPEVQFRRAQPRRGIGFKRLHGRRCVVSLLKRRAQPAFARARWLGVWMRRAADGKRGRERAEIAVGGARAGLSEAL